MSAKRTIASYDRIAIAYMETWKERVALQRAVDLFRRLLPSGALVLDVGCGPGFDAPLLRAGGARVIGFDLSWGMIAAGRINYPGTFVQADLRALPVAAGTSDGIWAAASLLHLRRPQFAPVLRQFRRLLRQDGLLYLSLKEGHGEMWTAHACGERAPRFFTFWQGAQLDEQLAAAGLDLIAAWRNGDEQVWLNRVARRI